MPAAHGGEQQEGRVMRTRTNRITFMIENWLAHIRSFWKTSGKEGLPWSLNKTG